MFFPLETLIEPVPLIQKRQTKPGKRGLWELDPVILYTHQPRSQVHPRMWMQNTLKKAKALRTENMSHRQHPTLTPRDAREEYTQSSGAKALNTELAVEPLSMTQTERLVNVSVFKQTKKSSSSSPERIQ